MYLMPPQARFDDCWLVKEAKSPLSIRPTLAPRPARHAAETAPLIPPPSTRTSNVWSARRARLALRSGGAGRDMAGEHIAATAALREILARVSPGSRLPHGCATPRAIQSGRDLGRSALVGHGDARVECKRVRRGHRLERHPGWNGGGLRPGRAQRARPQGLLSADRCPGVDRSQGLEERRYDLH